uniref:Smr domain-containing protein n=1 Tax=Entomoneis paludosa TaxID=265537 RepID=A0A7S2VBU0_9STRA|mmetsp:Transcript_13725/g.28347  ORF Transcript_13725/g.28347 Transcript_13725/m.28347 type:complete len:271 (+) Transcript_13725:94-906(+)|eukprot:CAMPEP_0172443084 /NCGR_PEP_ID=MMETSP1065-20121228/3398_1 /TAXON_ID=265537 /ORGANISM="Amphiprora paludosa, Strain CCMP125" /LENGTH=270 /DNA_ID=CAMNT_0013193179 /DNA_START=44 /DNA_END=856 /DNA_ORIENTATION=+
MGGCLSTSSTDQVQTPPSTTPTDAPPAKVPAKKEEVPAKKPTEAPTATETKEVISCKKVWVSHVIGPHGSTIKELNSSTGAHVNVGDSSHDPVSITITGSPSSVKAAKAKVEAIIKEAEHPDYEGAEGHKWREEADRCAKKAEECAKEKDALFDKGDKSAGHKKLDEVKEWQRKMHEANAKAADAIFENRNKGKGDRYMDFHGLRKKEAMDILEKKMGALKGKGGTVELIPGAGHHSQGAAVLKPAVIDYLKKNGYKYEEKNAGDLIVHL